MSQKASGFERKDGDQYMTPEWVVESLLAVIPMYGGVWEPACGEGAIGRVILRECGGHCDVKCTDINPAFDHTKDGYDFLKAPLHAHPQLRPLTIVTNPPYGKQGKLAEAFVRHAIAITQRWPHGRVAMLLPVAWDAAKGRRDLFEDFRGHITKITLTERIRWTNLPQRKSGPTENHAWFVWDHTRRGRDMRWLGRVSQQEETPCLT